MSFIKEKLIIGTYTHEQKHGLFACELDINTGQLQLLSKAEKIDHPSYLCFNNNQNLIYAVNETGNEKTDHVSIVDFNQNTNQFQLLQQVHSQGVHPCFISINKNNSHVYVANYTSGSIAAFKVMKDGMLSEAIQSIYHKGNSIHSERQTSAHAHACVLSPDEHFLLVADLGIDEIMVYTINSHSEDQSLTLKSRFPILPKGKGPRHLVFNQSASKIYLTLELTAELAVLNYDNGQIQLEQIIRVENDDFKLFESLADLKISNDGQFLYVSNRGEANSITVFKINSETGQLQKIQNISSAGKTPRNIALNPSNQYLLVAHQDSNNITVFKRDAQSGLLQLCTEFKEIAQPVCIQFFKN
jgi:6-phosphogluconolactonase